MKGRTTRMLLAAAIKVSAGAHVVLVGHNANAAKNLARTLEQIVANALIPNDNQISYISAQDGQSLATMTTDSRLFVDHYVYECHEITQERRDEIERMEQVRARRF